VPQFQILTYITVAAIKYVEWAIVVSGLHVVHIVLHLHLDAVALVVLAAFELLISILFT